MIRQHHFREQREPTEEQEGSTASSGHTVINEIISDDLQFLVPLLRKFPKCYWIWNYRLWLLEQSTNLLPIPSARQLWQEELGLVGKMLSLDSRNFLGWGYRRTVVAALESESLIVGEDNSSMVEQEFRYTTKMIETNLSNFSAWHNRSRLIQRLLDERGADENARQKFLDDGILHQLRQFVTADVCAELLLIQEALYTDPYDQSLWFYHHYLMCTFDPHLCHHAMASHLTPDKRLEYITGEIDKILDMLDGAEDCKWIYQSLIQLSTMYKASSGAWPDQAAGIRGWLSELRKLDPLRTGRWTDLDRALNIEV